MPGNTRPPAVKQQVMLACSLLIRAVLIWEIYCSVCVFTGPPGKRGRMGRRGEPGKWRSPPASVVYNYYSLFSWKRSFVSLAPSLCPWISLSSDPRVRPRDDGLQAALLPVPPYLRRHGAHLGHVVVLTLPRCESFSLSGSSCSSVSLMRFSLANITTRHYTLALSFLPDRKRLIVEPKLCRDKDTTHVTQKDAMTDRADVL